MVSLRVHAQLTAVKMDRLLAETAAWYPNSKARKRWPLSGPQHRRIPVIPSNENRPMEKSMSHEKFSFYSFRSLDHHECRGLRRFACRAGGNDTEAESSGSTHLF
jgi:hypothetical protein